MNPLEPRCLVIGCGSIGERHVRTFLATGRVGLVACDPRPGIREHMKEKYGVDVSASWKEALRDPSLHAVVIATPAPLHIPMAMETLERGRHVLIEKPLALDLAGTTALVEARDRAGRFVAVAYIHHCQPSLQAAREFIRAGRFGAVKHATISTGHHFPTARPAYREIYYRDHAQGGGALVTYSLNHFQAPKESRLDFHAEGGSVRVELHAQRWGTIARGASEWTWHAQPVAERDRSFVEQANAFLDGCEGRAHPLCSLEDGIQTLRFNLAALQSWRENRPIIP